MAVTAYTRRLRYFYYALVVGVSLLVLATEQITTPILEQQWRRLKDNAFFKCTYFETWWAVLCYPVVLAYPYSLSKFKKFDKYKIEKKVKWQSLERSTTIKEALMYILPLMVLDTFIVKRYPGSDETELEAKRNSFIQIQRVLPNHVPSMTTLVIHVLLSLVIYDLLFYSVHRLLHSSPFLYKYLHSEHHQVEDVMFARVTNRLSFIERTALVMSANFALRIVGAHPLTRAVFVPAFLLLLVHAHSAYSLPFLPDAVFPAILSTSVDHYRHHMRNSSRYQPFLKYIDDYFNPPSALELR